VTNALDLAIGSRKADAVPPDKVFRVHTGKTDLKGCLRQAAEGGCGDKALEWCNSFADCLEDGLMSSGIFIPVYWSSEAFNNLSFVVAYPTTNRFVIGSYRLKSGGLPSKVKFSVFHGNEQVTQSSWKNIKVPEKDDYVKDMIQNCVINPLTIEFPEGSFRLARKLINDDHEWNNHQRIVSPSTYQMWTGRVNLDSWREVNHKQSWSDVECSLFIRFQDVEIGTEHVVAQNWDPQTWSRQPIDPPSEPIEWASYPTEIYEIEQDMSEDFYLAPLPSQI